MFVMPSLYEPYGIVFAEAMAHRLPCIGADNCAMPEIIKHGETGYVVPVRDEMALANRLVARLPADGRQRIREVSPRAHLGRGYAADVRSDFLGPGMT